MSVFKKLGIIISTAGLVVAGFSAFLSVFGPGPIPGVILSIIALIGAFIGAILGARRTALVSLLTVSPVLVFMLSAAWLHLPDDPTLGYLNMAMVIVTSVVGVLLFRNYRASRSDTKNELSARKIL